MPYETNLKTPWEQRARFESTLIKNGWRVYRELKGSTIFQKEGCRLEVDDYGLFLWEFLIHGDARGTFYRTHGLSDDRIDEGYYRENNSNVLKFKVNKGVKRFNLREAMWVK